MCVIANPHEPHFFKPRFLTIPLGFFSTHIEGKKNQKTWKLRSDASYITWEVIQEGRRLTRGDMVFHVTPFGPSCCEIQYTHPNIIKEEADADDAPSFSFDYCFLAEVTASNLKEDKLYLSVGYDLYCFEQTMPRDNTCEQRGKLMDCEFAI
ncbi:hypothetical protein Bca52824_035401 [Brassica carinata]|uniref:Uncharacterized protein n=1 Tax=Brassica carinata TaxID=52824 RepID=A0A8X7S7H8_BRACI|nr:hypothetical protein Bca52824_035401 [Brassica carinata]